MFKLIMQQEETAAHFSRTDRHKERRRASNIGHFMSGFRRVSGATSIKVRGT
jgi:hypothetical protein